MEFNLNKRFSNFLKRDWIQKDEGKLTYIQLFGFLLITLGIIYLSSFLLPSGVINYLPSFKLDDDPTPNGISIAFFTTMLGVAFAFPDMLKGQTKEISTMRIIVFMFANVICMLLLKIGWDKPSLTEIGLDGFWMGVIAFLFGAKATQAYFENAKSFFHKSNSDISEKNKIGITKIAVAQLAKVQNEEKLHEQFPNIEFISDTIKEGESCITIYLKDDDFKNIPSFIEAQLNDHTTIKVQTEVVSNIGKGIPHYGQLTNDIVDSNTTEYFGSICCLVDSVVNPSFKGVITSGHIFTFGKFIDYEGFVKENRAHDAISNGNEIGKLHFQQMTSNQDLAIVELSKNSELHNHFLSFSKGFYKVTLSDMNSKTPNVTILSRKNNKRDAFLIDFNVSMRLYYKGAQKIMRNIILIGSDIDKNRSKSLSDGGDSGSCVYHKDSKKLIGMLLGGNDKFSFVLPLEEILNTNNFKIK